MERKHGSSKGKSMGASHHSSHGVSHHSSSAGWEREGHPLNASYNPSPAYAPERCHNGMDHNPFGFREEMSQAHGIRR